MRRILMTKTVFITGASSGFGKETALLFKSKGWNVVATMRSPEKATSWSDGLFVRPLDVTDRASMQRATDESLAKFGNIDVLVNNAGFALAGPVEGASPEDIRRQIDTNVVGLIEMTQLVLPAMRKAGGGVIVNLSSVSGLIAGPLTAPYNATKYAVEGFTEALQYELGLHRIRVKLIEPGGSKTNFVGSSLAKAVHPAYEPLTTNMITTMEKMSKNLPGPEKVAARIYQAATDGSNRLRYPVIPGPFLAVRSLLGARAWFWLMNLITRRMAKPQKALLSRT
jgi:NAD(P)-dependent dehydrogenase (short-subunit alcohol dehydrogenase family)